MTNAKTPETSDTLIIENLTRFIEEQVNERLKKFIEASKGVDFTETLEATLLEREALRAEVAAKDMQIKSHLSRIDELQNYSQSLAAEVERLQLLDNNRAGPAAKAMLQIRDLREEIQQLKTVADATEASISGQERWQLHFGEQKVFDALANLKKDGA